jgi:3-phenylpropionate/trans-cinnamate dioxygenase ferredoxin component
MAWRRRSRRRSRGRDDDVLIEVAKTSDIPEGEARRFVVNRIEVAVANLGGGTFLAVDDICSHAESSLSEGEVDVDTETIECPRHGSTFDLRSGKPRTLPATLPIVTFPVKVEGDTILIELED